MISPDTREDVRLPLKVGQSFSRNVRLDAESIRKFADLVGDSNPLHHNEEAAKQMHFDGLIASGTQTSSVLAAMISMKLSSLRPSLGLEVAFSFHKPVYADIEMVAIWEITSISANEKLRGDIVTFSGQLLTLSPRTLLVSGNAVCLVK